MSSLNPTDLRLITLERVIFVFPSIMKFFVLILKIAYTIILKNVRMLLRIFWITVHYILHLATCLHVVNLYAHDSIYVNICMPQKKKKFPEITPNSRIICYGHYYIHVGYFATTEVQWTQDIYIFWLLSRMSIWPREITNTLWDSLQYNATL